MNKKADILFKIQGKGLTPKTFRGRDLAQLVYALEEGLREIVISQHPEIKEDEIYVAVAGVVEEGSAKLPLVPSLPLVAAAYSTLAISVSSHDFSGIPPKTTENLKLIQRVVSRYENGTGSFVIDDKTVSYIDRETKIQVPESAFLTGETILYGILGRIGGSVPKLRLLLREGHSVSFDCNVEFAQQAASYLYKEVGIRGEARWQFPYNNLVSFRPKDITQYEPSSVLDAFKELRDAGGKYWDDVEDVEEMLLNA